MAFTIASAPHGHSQQTTATKMRLVILALLPGIGAQIYFFGYGVLIQLLLASVTALLAEALILILRRRPLGYHLADGSALLTAALIAVAIPPLAPWWLVVLGTAFAIIVGKQLYGGLGHNPFNPAMIAYVLLLVSFPTHMTSWLPAAGIAQHRPDIRQSAELVLKGQTQEGITSTQFRLDADGITSATPLDTIKTQLGLGKKQQQIREMKIFDHYAGVGWQWVNLGFLLGGLFLLLTGTIAWHIPVSLLLSLGICSAIASGIAPETYSTPVLQLFSGASMLGAFFIATDPVTAATTPKGRLLFGAIIGVLIFIIRTWGGYPDGVAFAVLLTNILVPLLDNFTRPRIYGQ